MTAVAVRARLRSGVRARLRLDAATRFVLGWLLVSRAVVLAGALGGALLGSRQAGWSGFDSTRLTEHFGAVGNALAAAVVRWDSIHYLAIAAHGYSKAADTVFFPLYPLLIAGLTPFTGSAVIAGAAISFVAFAVALILVHRLTRLELGDRAADTAVLLLCFAPLTVFFTAVYTESLFLALAVGAILAARRRRWALACSLAALAAVTRVPGVLLAAPIAIEMLRARRRDGTRGPQLPWLTVIVAAPAAFCCYLAARGWGLLAPIRNQAAGHGHGFSGPLVALVDAVRAAAAGAHDLLVGAQPVYQPSLIGPLSPAAESVLLGGALVAALVGLYVCWRRLPVAYTAYAALAVVVCVASPVQGQPLQSLDRYLLTIPPLWMAAGTVLGRSSWRGPVLVLGGLLAAFYAFQFATWAYVA
jgi:hypothetical protein